MARTIAVALAGKESSFAFKAVERSALYGKRRRVALDANGEPCGRASLLEDGSLILKSGMTGQGYFLDDGSFMKQTDLEGFDVGGTPVAKVPINGQTTVRELGTADAAEAEASELIASKVKKGYVEKG